MVKLPNENVKLLKILYLYVLILKKTYTFAVNKNYDYNMAYASHCQWTIRLSPHRRGARCTCWLSKGLRIIL